MGKHYRPQELAGGKDVYQFFVEDAQVSPDAAVIEGSDVNHIRNVLRMRCGEKVRISSK